MSFFRGFIVKIATFVAALVLASQAQSATLSPVVQKMLGELKLDPRILDGAEDELKMPQAWTDGVKKEGAVVLYDTLRPPEWKKLYSVFAARFPDVKIEHSEARTSARRFILPLTAFGEGRYLADIIIGLSGNAFMFRQAHALEDLSGIPNYKFTPKYARQPDNITAATRIQYFCMSYNTRLVKPADLPKTWEDLVDGTRFAGGKLLVVNRPNDWILYLWDMHGDAWGKAFVRKLFDNLHPQLRKETLTAVANLTALGEGDAAVPQAMYRVGALMRKGAPLGYHCPEPVPFVLTELGLMKGSPHINGAKIFIDWLLSKEGQIAQYWANKSTPVREDLRGKEFLDFPEAVAGKKLVTLGQDASQTSAKLIEYWNARWQAGWADDKK